MPTRSEHHRRSIRLSAYDYTAPGAYFLTIVTFNRGCLFGHIADDEVQLRIAQDCWRAIPEHFPHVELGAYVVMPNHLHGILIVHDRDNEVGAQHAAPLPRPGCPDLLPASPNERVRSRANSSLVRSFGEAAKPVG